jgi:hypothetical protein
MTDDTLQQFFGALVAALRARGAADLSGPFTVAEIYQDLVPYRTYRDILGFEMNGDYEHALLLLLAGREGYLELGSEHALKEIRSELDGKNPDTSLYRDFAAVDVRIAPGMVPPADAVPPEPEPSSTEESVDDGDDAEAEAAVDDGDDAAAPADPVPAPEPSVDDLDSLAPDAGGAPDTSDAPSTFIEGAEPGTSRPVPSSGGDGACPWCRSDLPPRDGIVFCPFCGEDQSRAPCRSCGEALEPDWEFCISCGAKKAQ